ncbi:Histone-lysine N-methyltransferase protein [Dioscorea alata]|uniref:Histone-lysine N-methyltransferase protein n=1 Tax=Dioscorea alata TaxID=55571 RepID=A0ACB7VL27_DIOAL|nr:Histone-lysine N-methyltransferase protein [Dioscorea alata]
MPDLSNLLPVLQPCTPTYLADGGSVDQNRKWSRRSRFPVVKRDRMGGKKLGGGKSLGEYLKAWAEKKMADGSDEKQCSLPFLDNAPRMVECCICSKCIHPGEELSCSVSRCRVVYHRTCAPELAGLSKSRKFKCPQHACFNCKKKSHWRCVRCTMATHPHCSPWPMRSLPNRPGWAVCWKHPADWRMLNKHADLTGDIEEAFQRLPLPYMDEEFSVGMNWKDFMESQAEPAPYVHIKRNIYLFKKKRDYANDDVGCRNCTFDSTCRSDCECRGLSISCSKACHCADSCQNRPFRKDKKIKVVKTKLCGWGVEALESIEKGDFVIEYIGEVIDDAACEQRLWDMKRRGDQNFYMCEIRKDFTIDATFKGNASRFLNHSCDPNCKLEKWQVDGETRVGVFASRSIKPGEPLTYDYRFVHFGSMVKCFCGASNCQGFLGSKRKNNEVTMSWGCKRPRTAIKVKGKQLIHLNVIPF